MERVFGLHALFFLYHGVLVEGIVGERGIGAYLSAEQDILFFA